MPISDAPEPKRRRTVLPREINLAGKGLNARRGEKKGANNCQEKQAGVKNCAKGASESQTPSSKNTTTQLDVADATCAARE